MYIAEFATGLKDLTELQQVLRDEEGQCVLISYVDGEKEIWRSDDNWETTFIIYDDYSGIPNYEYGGTPILNKTLEMFEELVQHIREIYFIG